MLVGTIATTYSGWFIAPSLAIMLSKKPSAGPVRASTTTTTTAAAGAAAEPPVRKSKSQRKARAT